MKQFVIGAGITSVCNMNCPFCYSVNRRSTCSNLSIEQWVNFFRKNIKLIKSINYGTSENTLCNDWYSLVDSVNRLDKTVGQALTTNGTLTDIILKDPIKEEIIRRSISDIDVSLDFASEKQHNEFRGSYRAYQMARDTLEYCRKNRKNTTIVIMGVDDTLDLNNLDGLFSIASQYDALIRLNIYRDVNKGGMLTSPSFDVVVKALDWISEHHEICALSDPLFAACFTQQDIYEDTSGKYSLRILPDGGIYPSTYLINSSYCLGNITSLESLNNIPNHPIIKTMVDVTPKNCMQCPVVKRCKGGALDRRMLTYGTADSRDYYCPFENDEVPGFRNYHISNSKFSSIHNGYLPTLFFKPKGGETDAWI